MPKNAGRPYTPDEDARILGASSPDALREAALALGRSVGALYTRRMLLRQSRAPTGDRHDDAEIEARPRPQPAFARPDWFQENLGRLASARH